MDSEICQSALQLTNHLLERIFRQSDRLKTSTQVWSDLEVQSLNLLLELLRQSLVKKDLQGCLQELQSEQELR